jgi:DNA-binding transcriptional ArsR family regulator
VDPINRPMPGGVGSVRLIVYKDRPGAVRAISSKAKEQIAGIVTLDSTVDGITRVWIDPPKEDEVVLGDSDSMETKLQEFDALAQRDRQILGLFDDDPEKWLTTKEVALALGLTEARVRGSWDRLSDAKAVLRDGENKHTRYRLAE